MSSDIYPNSPQNTEDEDGTQPILTGRVRVREVPPADLPD